MKTKNVVLAIAGGVMAAGTAIVSWDEINRLKKVISAQEKAIKSGKEYSDAQAEVIKKQEMVIENANQIIELRERQLAEYRRNLEAFGNVEPVSDAQPSPESPPDEPKKKTERKTQTYVFQYDTDFNVVAKYNSAEEAGRALGLASSSGIAKALTGSNISGAGYFWSRGNRPLTKIPERWKKAAVVLKEKKK